MKIRIRWLNRKTCEVTIIPGWFRRLFGAETRRGIAYRGTYEAPVLDVNGEETGEYYERIAFYWKTTNRYVGWRVMRCIDAAPLQLIEEMSVEQLLLEEPRETP